MAEPVARLVCVFFAFLFSVFSYRLIYLQLVMHEYYSKEAADKNVGRNVILAERGAIYDAGHEVLAQNVPVATVVADASLIPDPTALIPIVAESLQLPPDEIAEKIASGRRYIVLKREVPDADARLLEKNFARRKNCAASIPNAARSGVYPNGSMLCHVIGFSDFDQEGIQGVEASMHDYLRGEDGYRYIERDAQGREIVLYRGLERAPRNGSQVHLTIDMGLQTIVENELDAAMREYRPAKATIILMRPADRRDPGDGEPA